MYLSKLVIILMGVIAVIGSAAEDDPCSQTHSVMGPCEAYIPRYSYNQKLGKCVRFIYGGCGGNKNNFKTLSECEKKCMDTCKQTHSVTGPCEAYIPRYSYNQELTTCVSFIYGGCEGNDNNFETLSECEKQCVDPCKQTHSVVGPCDAAIPRFTFNQELKKCVSFVYGGCQGNQNNFEKLLDCEKKCVDPCQQTHSVAGPCKAYIPRYSYNQELDKCVSFIYGGCEGNDNNFETLSECEKQCVDPCKQTHSVVGPCDSAIPRFTFNQELKKCVSFIYGGCQGNQNNFEKLLECEKKCVAPCYQTHSVVGPCDGAFLRYTYNQQLGKCVTFVYGGCQGNANNFASKTACTLACL